MVLAFVVAAATVTPCCLDRDCGQETILLNEVDTDNEDAGCSPFFSCSACPGFVWEAKQLQVLPPGMDESLPQERSVSQHLPLFVASFWQPPRA
ncbi:hypothetical protein HRG84_03440 [Flavisolibacter sp. BT320]|nr:hypothetical protein [Flavisolibacter longurius]